MAAEHHTSVLLLTACHPLLFQPSSVSLNPCRSMEDASKCAGCIEGYRMEASGACEACKVANW